MNDQRSLSIVLPVYNEEENIQKTVEESVRFLGHQDFFSDYEVIVVNDGSTDRTPDLLDQLKESASVKVITHPVNLGYGRAMVSGIKEAKYFWLLLMDSDGQFKLSSLKKITEFLFEYDIIVGYRQHRADAFYRRLLGKFYSLFVCQLFGLDLKDVNCGFKLFKRQALHLNGEHYHAGVFYTDIFIKAKQNGHRIKEVPIEHFPRVRGRQTGASLDVISKAVMDLVKLILTKR